MIEFKDKTDRLIEKLKKLKKPERFRRLECLALIVEIIDSLRCHCLLINVNEDEFYTYNEQMYILLSDLGDQCYFIGDQKTYQFIDEMIFYFDEYLRLKRKECKTGA